MRNRAPRAKTQNKGHQILAAGDKTSGVDTDRMEDMTWQRTAEWLQGCNLMLMCSLGEVQWTMVPRN